MRLVETTVRAAQSSVGRELLWLLAFFAIFAVVAGALIKFVVPHHFNDRIAVLLAALISGLALIALRARAVKGAPRA